MDKEIPVVSPLRQPNLEEIFINLSELRAAIVIKIRAGTTEMSLRDLVLLMRDIHRQSQD